LGQHTTQTSPAWAIHALGPVPVGSDARRDWEQRAAAIAAYRETYGYTHPSDPIGPEPSHQTPGQRTAWHQAFGALARVAGPDVRSMPDGRLWLLRDAYTAETSWAPRHVGKDLRLARLGAFDAALGAIRADAEAEAARKDDDQARAERHAELAASYQALRDHYQQREQVLTQVMADRNEWEHVTARTRRLASAADAELRRRYPRQKIDPLRSTEPAPLSDTTIEQPDPAQCGKPTESFPRIRDLAIQHQAFRTEIDERLRSMEPGEDPAWGNPGNAFHGWQESSQNAILQPPKPEPSARIFELVAEHNIEPEAAD
jgi:hypothetical protein